MGPQANRNDLMIGLTDESLPAPRGPAPVFCGLLPPLSQAELYVGGLLRSFLQLQLTDLPSAVRRGSRHGVVRSSRV